MDYYILLFGLLGIIIFVLFGKIEAKGGIIGVLIIYLLMLVVTGLSLDGNHGFIHGEFKYSEMMMREILHSYMKNYFLFIYCFYFFFGYILCYFLYFILMNNSINFKKKIYFLGRDFIILFTIFSLFWIFVDGVGKYSKYYQWYLNPQIFGGEEFVCMDESATLILDRNQPHPVIVNPYKNYFDFYKNYGWALSNSLPKELLREDFLQTCVNKKGKNYYDEYFYLYDRFPYSKNQYNYKYILNQKQIENIVSKLEHKKQYIHNLIKHSYKEFDLGVSGEEFDEGFPNINLDEKIEEKRKLVYGDVADWEEYKYFEKFIEIPDEVESKKQILYSKERYKIPEWFFRKVKEENKGWAKIYTDGNINYTTTPTKLYKSTDLIFGNPYLVLGSTSSFHNIGKAGEKMSVEITYSDVKNIPEFQENNCGEILSLYNESYGKCYLKNEHQQGEKLVCENEDLLLDYDNALKKYQEVQKCTQLKYKKISTDIWTGGERMNKKYDILESKNMFEYSGKIGFIARSKDGYFIMYNGHQISENFDYIRTKSCCAIGKFPFKIYKNGILEFVFQRNENLFVGFLELQ